MKRVKFNVDGFDKLIPDGIPEGDAVLISGLCGSGKTVLATSISFNQLEPVVYLSLEESEKQIIENAKSIGIDVEKKIKEHKINIIKYDPYRLQDIIDMLKTNVVEIKAKFAVIDSVSALLMNVHDESEIRKIILDMITALRSRNCITILLSESLDEKHTSRFGVEEFVTDVVINVGKRNDKRFIKIIKCRATKHEFKEVPFSISSNGVKIG